MLGHIRQSANRLSSLQILLLELRSLATSIASEASLLVQREANQAKKIGLLEENHDKMISNLESLERELRSCKIKEREYLTKLEQMEADLARLETQSQSQIDAEYVVSPEMVNYLETNLQMQTSVSQIYRGLLEKVLQVVPAKLSSLVSDLAQNMIDQATLTIEEQFVNLTAASHPGTEKDWQESLQHRREAIENYSKNQAELRSEMEDLEAQLEAILQTSKVSQRVLLENQKKDEDLVLGVMRLTRPKSSYLYKTQEERRPKTPVQDFYASEAFSDSKTDFSLLKSKLKEIKSKLI